MKEGEAPTPKRSLETKPQKPITEAELKSETSNSLNKNKNTTAETVQLQPNQIAAAESTLNYFKSNTLNYFKSAALTLVNVNAVKEKNSTILVVKMRNRQSLNREKEREEYFIGFRVPKVFYEMYHSLSAEGKAIVKASLLSIIESLAKGDINLPSFTIANVNVAVSNPIQVVQQVVIKEDIKVYKEKLRKYEDFEKCVRAVLIGKYLNWDKQLQLCFEKLK
jgi:hypothetical protein